VNRFLRGRATVAALALLLASGWLARPAPAHGWGNTGHRVTGEIAWRSLPADVRGRVIALLPPGPYGSLAGACTWADTYARENPGMAWLDPYHYMTVDADAPEVDMGKHCAEEGCVVRGIHDAYRRFAGNASRNVLTNSMFRLTHFVGDVHQPLHVSHRDGHHGRETTVYLLGEAMSLHDAWDAGIIRHRLTTIGTTAIPDSLWHEYADLLVETLDPDSVTVWKQEAWDAGEEAPLQWANESLRLSRACTYQIADGDTLDAAYVERVMPVIDRRLQQAGVRMAVLIEAAVRCWTK